MSDERLTTSDAIKYLESIIYEDFAPYTQKCLLKVIEAARKAESMTADWEKRMERIVERLEETKEYYRVRWNKNMDYEDGAFLDAYMDAIEIVKGGGVDE